MIRHSSFVIRVSSARPSPLALRPSFARPRCGGTAYVAILALMMVVFTIAMGSLLAIRAQNHARVMLNDAAEARRYAWSAIEMGRLMIDRDPNWRTTRANGAWITSQAIGGGTMSLDVTNPSGALNNDPGDAVVMTATGRRGAATQSIRVSVAANIVPFTCLGTALSAGSSVWFGSTVTASSQVIASNGNVTASSSVTGDTEASGIISGSGFNGRTTSGLAARTLPDTTAFDFYIAKGTVIPIS